MYASQSKVLGLTIDDKLSFIVHAKAKLKQCWFAWHRITRKCTRYQGLNASSLRMLFKSVVLTKLLYAAPIWLKENLDTYKDFYSRVLLKISGATHHPPKDITSVALNIPPLEISYQMVTIKFIIKALTSDYNMQGIILQLEEAKAHRYHQHIDLIRQFLSWKSGGNRLTRSRINLMESVQEDTVSYSKDEISRFLDYAWSQHLRLSLKSPSASQVMMLLNTDEKSKRFFPRYSSRITDTKVMSLLHGHDLCFKAFNSSVTGNCDPQCHNCPALDNNFHRIFTCPLFNCSYQETLQQHSSSIHPSWSILGDSSTECAIAFRCLAQLTINELTCQ